MGNTYHTSQISERNISDILYNLGFSPSHRGYHYIKCSVSLIVNVNNDYLFNLTKMLYPQIAQEFKTTPANVERSIRYAINAALSKTFSRSDQTVFIDIYTFNNCKLTNSQFLAALVDYLRNNHC